VTTESRQQLFDSGQVARITGLPVDRVRQCVRHGLIVPRRTDGGHLRFDFVDLLLLRTTRTLLERPVPFTRIGRVLRSLREQIGPRPLARLSVYVEGDRVVAWDGQERWQPETGQLLFTFESDQVAERPGPVTRLPRSSPAEEERLSADEWCDLAMEVEGTSPLEARAAYHHALDVNPDHLVARINLGRLLHADLNLKGAEVQFREAVRSDPTCSLGWYNLGVVLEDQGRRDDAIASYLQAVDRDANLADAHWNLSLLYEQAGASEEAVHHLTIYRRITTGR
jgi:DNA-binding transcriptional MerR regulator